MSVRVFGYQHVGIGNSKVLHWGSIPMLCPKAPIPSQIVKIKLHYYCTHRYLICYIFICDNENNGD